MLIPLRNISIIKNKKGDKKISKIEKENAKAIEELKECDSIG